MSTTALNLSRRYSSFAGTDIRVIVDGQTLGTLQSISYGVQREKAPVYVMGRVDPLSFSRGKRGVAGTMISLIFDQSLMYEIAFRDKLFLADKDEILAVNDTPLDASNTADIDTLNAQPFNASDLSDSYQVTQAWYVDQLPPFDAVIVAANEYGQTASMRIYGIELMNEGSGFSIDDIVIESQSTYIALTIAPWRRLGSFDFATGAFKPPTQNSGVLQ